MPYLNLYSPPLPVKAEKSGICIGVGVSDKPEGPFVDAIGGPLVDEGDWNDIDPTVYIDDDGQAYLYFGNPELRCVKLNEDMISYDKSFGIKRMDMTEEAFGPSESKDKKCSYAEGPWFYKRNNLYYMVYPAFGQGGSENISYSTSESPIGPWNFGGVILQPNNCYTIHPGVCDFKGHSYLFYHNNVFDRGSSFHRSVSVEEFKYNEDGTIDPVEQTMTGVTQGVAKLNPYQRVEAETIAWERGVDIENRKDGGCNLVNIHDENYVKVRDVDFGSNSPLSVTVNAACEGLANEGTVEFRIDCTEDIESTESDVKGLFDEGFDLHNADVNSGELIAEVDIKSTGGKDTFKDFSAKMSKEITGVHDLFIVFKGQTANSEQDMFKLDYWSFEKKAEAAPTPSYTPVVTATTAPTVTPAPTTAPVKVAKVKSITVKKKGNGKVSVSWKKASGAKKYELLYSTDKKFKKSVKKVSIKKTSVMIKKLKRGRYYYFKVRGIDDKVTGKFSPIKKIKV